MLLPHLSLLDWLWAEPTGVRNPTGIIFQHFIFLLGGSNIPWLSSGLFNHHNAIWGKPESYHCLEFAACDSLGCRFLHVSTPGSLRRIVWHLRSQIRRLENCRAPEIRPLPSLIVFRVPCWPQEIPGIGMWVLQKSKKNMYSGVLLLGRYRGTLQTIQTVAGSK